MKCPKCSSGAVMVVTDRRDAIKCLMDGRGRTVANVQTRIHGHPLLATIGGIFSLGIWAVNSVFAEIEYKCPHCGHTHTETDFK